MQNTEDYVKDGKKRMLVISVIQVGAACSVLCFAVLCCASLCCAVLCCAVVCFAVLCCALLCCAMV